MGRGRQDDRQNKPKKGLDKHRKVCYNKDVPKRERTNGEATT